MAVAQGKLIRSLGARSLLRHGVWAKRTAPWEEVVETFTRSGTGLGKDRGGVYRSAATDVPRVHWVTDHNGVLVPSYLVEAAATNLVSNPEDLTHADWTDVGTPTEGSPHTASGVSLDLIGDDDGAALEGKTQVVSFTGDAVKAISVHIKESTSTSTVIRLRDTTAGADRLLAVITWSGGAPSVAMSTGTELASPELLTDGAYRLRLQTTSVTAANTNQIEAYPASDAALATGDTGNVYIGAVQAEDNPFPTIYTAASRNAEFLQFSDAGFTPADIEAEGGLTVLTEWVELGTAFIGSAANRYYQVGGPNDGSTPRMGLFSRATDGDLSGFFDDGTLFESRIGSAIISLFDHVRARTVIFLDGSDWKIQLHVSVNGGAETSASAATIGTSLPTAWSANTLTLGAAPDGTLTGFSALIAFKAALGDHSLSAMEAAA